MMWAAGVILLAGLNWLYERYLRPILADIFGWEPWTEEDYIPPVCFLVVFFVMSLVGFFAFVGAAVGL